MSFYKVQDESYGNFLDYVKQFFIQVFFKNLLLLNSVKSKLETVR